MNKIFIKSGYLIIEEKELGICGFCKEECTPTFYLLYNKKRYCKDCLEKELILNLSSAKRKHQEDNLTTYIVDNLN